MIVPFQAITGFNDPSVGFGLQFGMLDDSNQSDENVKPDNNDIKQGKKRPDNDVKERNHKTAEVVSLDTFRRQPNE
jgi:hypothetical protein